MTHELFGVRIDDISNEDLAHLMSLWLCGEGSHVIVTPNAEFLLIARRNEKFMNLLNRSDLAIPDSVSLQYAIAALTRETLRHRQPGVDLLLFLCQIASETHYRVLFLGGSPGSAVQASSVVREHHPGLDVIGYDPGVIFLDGVDQGRGEVIERLVAAVRERSPNIVAVGLGHVKQEDVIFQLKDLCPSVKIWIGVGGAFEMISGQKPRAPASLSRLGLEWLWRLWIEPKRWRRIMRASMIFPAIVAFDTIRQGTFIQSSRRVIREIIHRFSI